MADLQIHANLAIAAGATFIPVCSLSVGLRFYARRLKGVGFEADDWLILGALVSLFPPQTADYRSVLDLQDILRWRAKTFVLALGVTIIAGKSVRVPEA